MKYKLARLIERLSKSANHIFVWHADNCAWCREPTHWIEINFRTPTHRGRCSDEMLKAFG